MYKLLWNIPFLEGISNNLDGYTLVFKIKEHYLEIPIPRFVFNWFNISLDRKVTEYYNSFL